MQDQLALQNILRSRMASYQARNPRYSIRSFAKKVGVTPATLSLFLLGKRKLSRKLADRIADRLMLDPEERAQLLEHFPERKSRGVTREGDAVDPNYLQLTADQFQVVADWHYFAILNLVTLENAVHETVWIAGRLGLPVKTVQTAIERLLRLEMLERDAAGRFVRRNPRYRTTDDVAHLSLKKSHHQTLELAGRALDEVSVGERDFTWVTFPFEAAKLPQAKTLIRKFQDDLLDLLDEGAKPDEVYRMAIQFFPLTRTQK